MTIRLLTLLIPIAMIPVFLTVGPERDSPNEIGRGAPPMAAPPSARAPRPGGAALPAGGLFTPFIFNAGQTHPDVAYYARTPAGMVFVTRAGDVVHDVDITPPTGGARRFALREHWIGAGGLAPRGLAPSATRVSFFKGDAAADRHMNCATYETVALGEPWPGITAELCARDDGVETVFRVAPGADPRDIRVQLDGAPNLTVGRTGELLVHTPLGLLAFTRPVAYQELDGRRAYVAAAYAPAGDEYGFTVATYDATRELVIDPLLASTYLGTGARDSGTALAIAPAGDVYVAGFTRSSAFPTTTGAYDPGYNGSDDAFVARLDPTLHTLQAATFIGSTGSDSGTWLTLADDGTVYLLGNTSSAAFPTTPGAYATQTHGGAEVFLARFDADLQTLLACTYLGGEGADGAAACAVAADGTVYAFGWTISTQWPVTLGAYDFDFNGGGLINNEGGDLFLARLDANLTQLLAATYLGGSACDCSRGLMIDAVGDIYVAGLTGSADFPTSVGAYDRVHHGGGNFNGDVYVSKLDPGLSTLLASTFVGSSADDWAIAIARGPDDSVYITGDTSAADFPTTPDAFDREYHGGTYGDVYVARLNPELTELTASTLLGGHNSEWAIVINVDEFGYVYVSGPTYSADFPVTPAAYDTTFNGLTESTRDLFITRLDPDLTMLSASTFFGGPNEDWSMAIALDAAGNVCLTGSTYTPGCPTTPDAYQPAHRGNYDVLLAKFDPLLTACLGDLDGDGTVGLADLARLLGHYGAISGAAYADGDLDGDGDVDLGDLAELLGRYGDPCL